MEMKDGQPDIAIIDEQRNVQIRIGIRTDNECPHVILAKGPGNPVILLSIDDSLAPIGSASIHLTGDYPGEGRKEIVLCNGEPLFEPSITLNSNGVTIAKLPTSKAKKSPKSAKSKRKSANVKAKK